MLKSIFIKDNLSIKLLNLEFHKGLSVFTGASAAGKSILMQSILASLGFCQSLSSYNEIHLDDFEINDEAFHIEDGECFIKFIRKDKLRFFLNNQYIAKSKLKSFMQDFVLHINSADNSIFSNTSLLSIVDALAFKNKTAVLDDFKLQFKTFQEKSKILQDLQQRQKQITDLKAFTKFEIDKIDNLNPQEGELEELLKIKKMLSQKDKIDRLLSEVDHIFALQRPINKLYEVLNTPANQFNDSLEELKNIIHNAQDQFANFDEANIEQILNRIHSLNVLIKQHGSIQAAINYKKAKITELARLENLDQEALDLKQICKQLEQDLKLHAKDLSRQRSEALKQINLFFCKLLEQLRLEHGSFYIIEKPMDISGIDEIVVLKKDYITKLSAGELNRLRLALLVTKVHFKVKDKVKVLILDEMDANVSGEESFVVAKLLLDLAQYYQVLSISHQPQLTAMAHWHYLVSKVDHLTSVKLLNDSERIDEIARIISIGHKSNNALAFAKELLVNYRQKKFN